jgi:hypothetical protein
MPEKMMTALMQADLVHEIAELIGDYRKDASRFVKFGMKGAIALNRFPAAGGIMHSPKKSDEHFKIGDVAFRQKFDTDRQAYFAAFDTFVANAEFVAWDGTVPDPRFVMLEELSEKFTWQTMMVELVYRKRGADQEKKLSMFFIGFPDAAKAADYAQRHAGLLIASRPFSGKFHDWV